MNGKAPQALFSSGLTDNNFDLHASQTVKAILDRMIDLMDTEGGIFINSLDETDLQVIDAGGGSVSVKAGVGWDKFGQRIYLGSDDSASAIVVGTVSITTLDLSTNKNIKLDIDNAGATQIDCSSEAAVAAAATLLEILAAINAAGYGTIAFQTDAVGNFDPDGTYITLKSPTTGGSSEVEFQVPSANDAGNEIFGITESGYPQTSVGGGGYDITDDSITYNIVIEHVAVDSVIGNFIAGYPSGSDTEYTRRDDSYKITVTTADPADDADEHELLLAQVSNTGGTLTITDKRADKAVRLKGIKQVDNTPPSAPVLVNITTTQKTSQLGYIIPRWAKVTDASGIREYIIKMVLIEDQGVAVVDAQPEFHSVYAIGSTAAELYTNIMKPLGEKYQVYVAAVDNSLSQNQSAFTDLGAVLNGGQAADYADVVMPQITLVPVSNGVYVDWAESENLIGFQYCFTTNGSQPQFLNNNTFEILQTEVTVQAAPGTEIKIRVRGVLPNNTKTDAIVGESVAGGVVIGNNEKVLSLDTKSVLATDDGAVARFLGQRILVNPADITKLALYVSALTLNDSERGVVRIFRENAEAQARFITFTTTGTLELDFEDFAMTAGWIIIDAYDDAESGSSQAAFTVDAHLFYAEGVEASPVRKGRSEGKGSRIGDRSGGQAN